MKELIVSNDISNIGHLAPFLDEVAEEYGVAHDVMFKIQLALDEAMTNSISYAYPEDADGRIALEVEAEGAELLFRLIDEGIPFDPTKEGNVDTTLSVEERSIGGLGIFLIKQMMDYVGYEYVDGKNILIMRKTIK